jgi:hypothetical protein
MIRRSPQAILAAHKMDRERRELYVEGSRDRLFFAWLLGREKNPNAAVVEIAMVESLEAAEGGERGRLLAFAEWMVRSEAQLKCFADADWDRLFGRGAPANVWLTDKRDLEGYTLREECLEKVLRLGMATERLDARALLATVLRAAREVGILRVLSVRQDLRLPFQKTDLWKHLVVTGGTVSVRPSYLRALMQNAGIGLGRLAGIQADMVSLATELAEVPNDQLVHGKDAFCMLERVLAECGAKRGEGSRMMWTSFERVFVDNGSALSAAYQYLGAP